LIIANLKKVRKTKRQARSQIAKQKKRPFGRFALGKSLMIKIHFLVGGEGFEPSTSTV